MMQRLLLVSVLLLGWAVPVQAQSAVDATEVLLWSGGAGKCTFRTGNGAPSGGSTCDTYLDYGTGILYTKLSTGTWQAMCGFGSSTTNGVLYKTTSACATTAQGPANSVLTANAGAPSFSADPNVASLTAMSGNVGTDNFASQTSGWRCTYLGACDDRYHFSNEMRIKLLSAEEQAVYRGSLEVTPSYSEVSQAFTCPAAAGTATLWVRDAATLADARVFTSSDWVVIRTMTRADADTDGAQEVSVADCVGQVTSYADGTGANAGQQSWTFTRGSGGSAGAMSSSTVVAVGNVVLDYGTSGRGSVEISAVDGTEGINAPYVQVKSWTTSPVAANFAVRARLGKLTGITSTANEFGLIAGTYAASDGQYFRASNSAFELHGIDLSLWDSTTRVVRMAPNSGSPYFGLGNPAPSACCATAGVFLGWDHATTKAKASFYADSSNFWTFDGSKVTWKAANSELDSSGNFTATNAIIRGNVSMHTGGSDALVWAWRHLTGGTYGTFTSDGPNVTSAIITAGAGLYAQDTNSFTLVTGKAYLMCYDVTVNSGQGLFFRTEPTETVALTIAATGAACTSVTGASNIQTLRVLNTANTNWSGKFWLVPENYLYWDADNLHINTPNLVVDPSGVTIPAVTAATWSDQTAYAFRELASGAHAGVWAYQLNFLGDTTAIRLESLISDSSAATAMTTVRAGYDDGVTENEARIDATTTETDSAIRIKADSLNFELQAAPSGHSYFLCVSSTGDVTSQSAACSG